MSRPLRILLVEDNTDAAEMLRMLLSLWGHEVNVAHEGPAAVTAAQIQQPDVVLLDVDLPGMDGSEVARRLRAQSGTTRPFLIALTGYSADEAPHRFLPADFDSYFVKPFDPARLQEVLAQR